jgi:hypothetical protein
MRSQEEQSRTASDERHSHRGKVCILRHSSVSGLDKIHRSGHVQTTGLQTYSSILKILMIQVKPYAQSDDLVLKKN